LATSETPREVRAQAKWVRTSAQKARLVLEHIRGRSVPEARSVLAFSERAVARDIELVLRSAVANAEANHGLIGDELVVAAAYADEGPMLKKTCHITVRLAERPEGNARPRRPQAGPAGEEAPKPRRRPAAQPQVEDAAAGSEETTKPKRAPRKKKEETTA
jgi:large subunit ribosomal protein L22